MGGEDVDEVKEVQKRLRRSKPTMVQVQPIVELCGILLAALRLRVKSSFAALAVLVTANIYPIKIFEERCTSLMKNARK